MTTNKDNSSSFGTIIFTTNIPGDKEHTLDPTVISYSDNPDLKITIVTNGFYKPFFTEFKNINFFTIVNGNTRAVIAAVF